MNPDGAALAGLQGFEITLSLRGFKYTERHLPTGDIGISGGFRGDLNEYTIVRAALWSWPVECWKRGP